MPSIYCCSTAPTAVSEASVIMLLGASGSGYMSKTGIGEGVLSGVECRPGSLSPV